MGKLTAVGVKALREPGRYSDGDGLYLQVARGKSRQWIMRYKVQGKSREMGLGPVGDAPDRVPLAEARRRAAEARALLRDGKDPIEARRAAERDAERERAKAAANTFETTALAYVAAREGEWRNAKHKAQWTSTLTTYAFPKIGDRPVSDVDTEAVLEVLQPVWAAKPETASRLRGRIESVLDYAKTRGLRTGENPARWRGHLAHSLAKPSRLRRKRHHPALPWHQVGAFVAELRAVPDVSARALEFLILTAARTGEALGARWREIDLDAAVWTVPGERMKAGREHRVPLSAPALAVLRTMQPLSRGLGSPVFPGRRFEPPAPGASGPAIHQPQSNMALEMLLRRMNQPGKDEVPAADGAPPLWSDRNGEAITAHGFRSSFRDWVGEASTHSTDLAEAALAHVIRDKTVAAYARGDLFAKRARLMADWADACERTEVAAVVSLNIENMRQRTAQAG